MKRNLWKLTTLVSVSLLGLGIVVETVDARRQINMKDARRDLKRAETSLENAIPDKGGHRDKAIDLVKQALDEVDQGIEFAKHDHDHDHDDHGGGGDHDHDH